MANDLVDLNDLADFPGSPFAEGEVDAAVAALRDAAGWHIAPIQTDTVEFDVEYAELVLHLPTRRLIDVIEVRDADSGEIVDPDTYEVSKKLAQVQLRYGYWPTGYERIEADISHGFDECPLPLLAVIAEAASTNRRDQSVKSEGTGPFTIAFGVGGAALTDNPIGSGAVLQRYSLLRSGFA